MHQKLWIHFILFLALTACNSGFESHQNKRNKGRIDTSGAYLTNQGEVLTHESIPLEVAFGPELPETLVDGCASAIQKINDATGINLLSNPEIIKSPRVSVTISDDVKTGDNKHPAHTDVLFQDHYIITNVLITFDQRFLFSNDPKSNEYDAESVCLHELGHALGLMHTSNDKSIMYYGLKSSEIRRELAPEDIQKIVTLYGQ